jgi:hypothetical protein
MHSSKASTAHHRATKFGLTQTSTPLKKRKIQRTPSTAQQAGTQRKEKRREERREKREKRKEKREKR